MDHTVVPLWEDPSPLLIQLKVPRIVRIGSTQSTVKAPCKASRILLRATAEQLHSDKLVHMMLALIEAECGLIPDLWRRQAVFFRNLIRGFFGECDDSPAWLLIAGPRTPFTERRETAYVGGQPRKRPHQRVLGHEDLFAGKYLGSMPILMGRANIPTVGLMMCGNREASREDLFLHSSWIRRTIFDRGQKKWITADEWWCYLTDRSNSLEVPIIEAGHNPSGLQFNEAGVQTAPLVSLAKVDKERRSIKSRSFSLSPLGHVLDFREIQQSFHFAMNTDVINATVHRNSTEGQMSDQI